MARPETTYPAIIGQVVRYLRTKARKKEGKEVIDQGTLAEEIGLSRSAYSRIETGEVAPNIEHLAKIAGALDTSLSTIFSMADDIADQLRDSGYIIHEEALGKIKRTQDEKPESEKEGVGLGGLVIATALGAIVGGLAAAFLSKDSDDDDD
ncbi:MAG: helix-turn-helix transcriptional regulator [Gammaproteobacteria bacterium AqS3]|nr:helix-turn-helix transcriptional regulator [Gammaproteobacteria bacterium AqS3]